MLKVKPEELQEEEAAVAVPVAVAAAVVVAVVVMVEVEEEEPVTALNKITETRIVSELLVETGRMRELTTLGCQYLPNGAYSTLMCYLRTTQEKMSTRFTKA